MKKNIDDYVKDARPDTLDFRDSLFVPTLTEVPQLMELAEYRKWKVPVLDQGKEGACTGFGLATVANYLLRRRKQYPDFTGISPHMFYAMARRYDEWSGENYEGSSARGAMKGWQKHGVCNSELWKSGDDRGLSDAKMTDAQLRPLGAYFRVNHKDLVAMHCAMAEVGILYVTSVVHEGWRRVDARGVIPFQGDPLGGHAFAIVAYDEKGFWIQNSWGEDWGKEGFALITYDDWLANATDVWVARLGVPVHLEKSESSSIIHASQAGKSSTFSYSELRPHIVSIGNDGALKETGQFGTSRAEVATIFEEDFERVTAGWGKKRLLLYAHGGLVDEDSAIQHAANYRAPLLDAQVYPLSFVWHSDFWSMLKNMLQDAFRSRRTEGFLDAAKDFMYDRLDDLLEPLARVLMGKSQWDEMKEDALLSTERAEGGARWVLEQVARLAAKHPDLEIHIAGHSAGSIFLAPMVRLLTAGNGVINSGYLAGQKGYGLKITSGTLWAPACTVDLFKQAYWPAIQTGGVDRFAVFALTDKYEQDDSCAGIYHKSLLYLVANAFEAKRRQPFLGMEKYLRNDPDLKALFASGKADLVLAPNTAVEGSQGASTARHHGDFDDDKPTFKASLARILGKPKVAMPVTVNRSASTLHSKRKQLMDSLGT